MFIINYFITSNAHPRDFHTHGIKFTSLPKGGGYNAKYDDDREVLLP